MIKELVKLANELDSLGLRDETDRLDYIIRRAGAGEGNGTYSFSCEFLSRNALNGKGVDKDLAGNDFANAVMERVMNGAVVHYKNPELKGLLGKPGLKFSVTLHSTPELNIDRGTLDGIVNSFAESLGNRLGLSPGSLMYSGEAISWKRLA